MTRDVHSQVAILDRAGRRRAARPRKTLPANIRAAARKEPIAKAGPPAITTTGQARPGSPH